MIRRLLCAMGFHAYIGTKNSHTYICVSCGYMTAGHP